MTRRAMSARPSDKELLAKAKAGRTAKLQSERALEKSYVTKNDLKVVGAWAVSSDALPQSATCR